MSAASDAVWLILVAAGRGERLGSDVPKAFVELAGRPLFSYAVESAALSGAVTRVLLVAHPELGWEAVKRLSERSRSLVHGVVCGGEERHDSVREGLRAVRAAVDAPGRAARRGTMNPAAGPGGAPALAGGDPVVLVHDAARPFAPPDLFARMAEACARGPAVCVRAIADTVKEVDNGVVARSLSRERLAVAQTPQGARLSLLERAHERAPAEGVTDDAMLLEALGEPVLAVRGADANFKITTPEDLKLAEAWARAGGAPWMP